MKEIAVRASVIAALEKYHQEHGNYGISTSAVVPESQIRFGTETLDVSIDLENPDKTCKILVPVKSRETEGGAMAPRANNSGLNLHHLDTGRCLPVSRSPLPRQSPLE